MSDLMRFVFLALSLFASPQAEDPNGAPFPAEIFETGCLARGVVLVGAKGDGMRDAVVVGIGTTGPLDGTASNGVLAVLAGRRGARFARPSLQPVLDDPRGLAAGDFDGDGLDDLLVWGGHNRPDDPHITLQVLSADGAGGFSPGWAGTLGSRPVAVALGDLNGDGALDAIVADQGGPLPGDPPPRVIALRGNGAGAFSIFWVAVASTSDVDLADINGDGVLDLLLPRANAFGALPSAGQSAASQPAVSQPALTPLGGADGFGGPCCIAPGWLRGLGDGDFDAPQPLADNQPWLAQQLQATDFDDDGDVDVLARTSAGYATMRQLGRNTTVFEAGEEMLGTSLFGAFELLATDLDADAFVDLLVVSSSLGMNTVLTGVGDGTFAMEQDFQSLSSSGGRKLPAAADLDRDGHVDVLLFDRDAEELTVLRGRGLGAMHAPEAMSLAQPQGFPLQFNGIMRSVAVGDIDGDAWPDIAVANDRPTTDPTAPSLASIIPGVGGFTPYPAAPSAFVGARPRDVVIANVDGQGPNELILVSATEGVVDVLSCDGQGGFAPRVSSPVGLLPQALAVMRLDGDGILDLVVSNAGSHDLTLLTGVGDGRFTVIDTLPLGAEPGEVVTADIDRDGRTDLIVVLPALDTVRVLRRLGAATFSSGRNVPMGAEPRGLVVTDFDGDGWLDLATANVASADISLRLGGRSGFGPESRLLVRRAPRALAAGDLDGDGLTDLAATHGFTTTLGSGQEVSGDGSVSILYGLGAGRFTRARRHAAAMGSASLTIADIDRDGLEDLVVGSAGYVTRLRHLHVAP